MVKLFKEEIRIIGFDDGPFEAKQKGTVPVIGVIYRGGKFLDGMLKTDVTIDGLDSTEKLINLINSSRHKQQLKVIMTDGITFAGFNIVDIQELHKKTGLPIIVINRKNPDIKKVIEALKNFDDYDLRIKFLKNAGEVKMHILPNGKKIYYQSVGLSDLETKEIINLSTTHSFIPEPLRVAHIIVTAMVKGESKGGA
jgi:endonuclease V-like protein UPF0215 family